MLTTRHSCPVCGRQESDVLDERERVSVYQNKLYATADEARHAAVGPLSIVQCRNCGFVWNRAFQEDLLEYDGMYENDQASSRIFKQHITEIADRIIASFPTGRGVNLLEVGCGQGQFISFLAKRSGARLRSATGFDPAWRGEDGARQGHARIYRSYFDKTSFEKLDGAPDIVVSRHTIEHVVDPIGFLRAIRTTLPSDSNTRIYIETPDVSWILRNGVVHDFFYEHCSLFTRPSLNRALSEAGFSVISNESVFGGQYQIACAQSLSLEEQQTFSSGGGAERTQYLGKRAAYLARWSDEVRKARQAGPVALWGAGAKGVTFAFLTDPDQSRISCVIDIKPSKHSYFIPLTAHPIVSPAVGADMGVKTIFVMNPNYLDEIVTEANARQISAEIICVD